MPDVGSRDHGSRREPSSDDGAGVAPLGRSGAKTPAGRLADGPDPGSGPAPAAGDSPPASDPLETVDYPEVAADGRSIAGYRLIRVLGEGGMGVVHLAEELGSLQRLVAIKIVRPERADTESAIRFENEAQILSQLEHPGIARIYAAGRFEGRPYYAMEYIQGEPITDWCARRDVPLKERHALFLSVCEAMAFVHDRQVIHRDLKPSNILVSTASGRPVVKIIDFGVAKTLVWHANTHPVHTEAGRAVGTPYYMSPEQVSGGVVEVDARSDVYALGVLLYELTTGEHPLDTIGPAEPSTGTLRTMIRLAPPEPPSRVLERRRKSAAGPRGRATTRAVAEPSDVKGALEAVILRALAKRPKDRYQSAAELASDLERFRAGHPVLARPRGRLRAAFDRLRYDPKRRRVALLVIGLTLAAGVAIATWKGATWLVDERYFENVTRAAALIDEGNITAAREIVSELRTKRDAFELDVLESRIAGASVQLSLGAGLRHIVDAIESWAIIPTPMEVAFVDLRSREISMIDGTGGLWHPDATAMQATNSTSHPRTVGTVLDYHWLSRRLALYEETSEECRVILHDLVQRRAMRLANWPRGDLDSTRGIRGAFASDGRMFRWSAVPGTAPRKPRCGSWEHGRAPPVEERASMEFWLPELRLWAERRGDRLEFRSASDPKLEAVQIDHPEAQEVSGRGGAILVQGRNRISIHDRRGMEITSFPPQGITLARLSDDGKRLLAARLNRVWVSSLSRPLEPDAEFTDAPEIATDLKLSGQTLIAVGSRGEFRYWSVNRPPERVIAREVLRAVPFPDGRNLLIARGGPSGGTTLLRRDLAAGHETRIAELGEPLRSMAFGRDGTLWLATDQVWRASFDGSGDTSSLAAPQLIPDQPQGVQWSLAVATGADAAILASRHPKLGEWEVWLLNSEGTFHQCRRSPPYDAPTDLAISADGRLALCRVGGSLLRIEQTGTRVSIDSLGSHSESRLSSSGELLAVGDVGGTIRIMGRDGLERLHFDAHTHPVSAILWLAADTRLLTRGEEGTLRLWDPQSGRRILTVALKVETSELIYLPRNSTLLDLSQRQGLRVLID